MYSLVWACDCVNTRITKLFPIACRQCCALWATPKSLGGGHGRRGLPVSPVSSPHRWTPVGVECKQGGGPWHTEVWSFSFLTGWGRDRGTGRELTLSVTATHLQREGRVCMCVGVCAEAKGGTKLQHTQSCSLSCSESHCLLFLSPEHTLKALAHTRRHTRDLAEFWRQINQFSTRPDSKGRKKQKKNWKSAHLFLLELWTWTGGVEEVLFFPFTGGNKLKSQALGSNKQKGTVFLIYCWTFGLGLGERAVRGLFD